MESHASHMLEAALEQMDDIIAGSKAAADFSGGLFELGSPGYPGPQQVLRLAEDLRAALEMQAIDGDRVLLRKQLPSTTADVLMQWLEKGMVNLQLPVNNETCQERLSRLEGDKESLVLQVSVLTEQVEAQGEKIRDLVSSLDEHQYKLCSTEEMLQQELFSRTSLETEKLDLMDEVSHLKLKLVGMEDQPTEGDSKQHKAECVVNLISELQEQMCKFQLEISSRIQEKRALEKQATDSSLQEAHQSLNPDLGSSEDHCRCRGENGLLTELKLLKSKVDELQEEKCQYEKKLKATKSLMTKLSSLKLTVEHTQVERQQWEDQCGTAQEEISDLQQLLAEKDAEIDCLQRQLSTRGPESTNGPEKALTVDEVYKRRLKDKYQELQRLKMGMETLLAENEEKGRRIDELTVLLSQYKKTKEDISLNQVSGAMILSSNSEEELNMGLKMRGLGHKFHPDTPQSEMSSNGSSSLLVSSSSFQRELDFSVEMSPDSVVSPSKTSVQNGSRIQLRALSSSLEELHSGSKKKHAVEEPVEPVVSAETPQIGDSNKCQTLPGKVSRSSLNGKREKHSTPIQKSPNESRDRAFALRKAEKTDEATFSDLSLPSSGNDSKQPSTVSPDNRKNHNALHKFWGRDMNTPFSKWTKEQVCGWLEDYGLGQYVNLARQWVNTGQTLLSATPQQLEKEMGIKHSLHRKKLQLALRSFNTKVIEKSSELDHIWVTRWLDDIGLPQYKDQFNEGRVDGRMIQYLTVNDLLFMKVTSQLHHLSIKCAIHVLHINKFNPHCLRRRPGDENKTSPSEVMQWSNHRVMEWLRSVDLAEYAPNLRGSGVHGGLIILEPRFNTETLAMLLNIPPQKTLLRRHLATNFSSLVGAQAQQEKRDAIQASGHNPLTTAAKVRPKKLGFTSFGHLRKKKLDDSTDYICPLDAPPPPLNGAIRPFSGFRGLSPILDRDPEKKDQVGQKSGCHPASTHHR